MHDPISPGCLAGRNTVASSSIAAYLFFRSGQMLDVSFKAMVFILIGALAVSRWTL